MGSYSAGAAPVLVAAFGLAALLALPAATPSTTGSFLPPGAWFVAQSLVFMMALVALASRLARLSRSDAAQRWHAGLSGLLFIGLALRLLRDRPGLA